MPSLKEIKNRIASVNSTRKITSAMKMVASSKLHHAQVQIEKMLPYENMLEHILKTFLASDADANSVYERPREVKKVALVVFSSNSSLCGGFNSNVIKLMQQAVAEREESVLYNEFCDLYEDTGRRVLEERAGDGLSRSSVILRAALRAQTEQTLAWMLAEPEMTEPKEKKHGSEKK